MVHDRAYLRKKSFSKAIRKKNICRNIYYDEDKYPYYSNLHQYADNKIHCSCYLCTHGYERRKRYNKYVKGYTSQLPKDVRKHNRDTYTLIDEGFL